MHEGQLDSRELFDTTTRESRRSLRLHRLHRLLVLRLPELLAGWSHLRQRRCRTGLRGQRSIEIVALGCKTTARVRRLNLSSHLTDRALPEVICAHLELSALAIAAHRDERHEADLEALARLHSRHRRIVTSRANSTAFLPIALLREASRAPELQAADVSLDRAGRRTRSE